MKLAAPGSNIELQPVRQADDADWCCVQDGVQATGFTGNFEAWLQTAKLEFFAEQLERLFNTVCQIGQATLSSAEGEIELVFSMHKIGGVNGRYAPGKCQLAFS